MYLSDQDIVRPLSDPLKKDSHLVVLYGNLAPEGAVAKITGKEGERFEGPARVFEGEERATQAILAGRVRAGDVVVIRQEGPRGGPGMREMLSPTSALMGRGLGAQVALITDGRFSGGSHGFVCWTHLPRGGACGPIGLLPQRGPPSASMPQDATSTCTCRRRSCGADAQRGGRRSRTHSPACSPSTRISSAAPRAER